MLSGPGQNDDDDHEAREAEREAESNERGKPLATADFARLFEEHRERFLRMAHAFRRRRGSEGGLETLDYVQDASCEFLKKPRDVKSESHFVQLFKGFLQNSFRGKRRDARAQKRGGGEAPARLMTDLGVPEDAAGPLTLAAQQEDEDRLLGLLATLDPTERQLITLRLWDELSWEELAARLELPSPEAARKRYTRTLARIAEAT